MVYIGMRHEKKRPCGSSFLPEAAARKEGVKFSVSMGKILL